MTDDELFELRLVVEELYRGLDTYPYHVFLGVDPSLDGDQLREAFHRRAETFHPDRHYQLADPALQQKIYAVYKRITEAYRVLSDPVARRRWDEQRAAGAPRLRQTGRLRSVRPEDALSEAARKYYGLARDAERSGDLKHARFNLQLALQLEPESGFLKELLAALERPT
jgi:DnaJ-class molecular chaperone